MTLIEQKIRDIVSPAESGLIAQGLDALTLKDASGSEKPVRVKLTAFVPVSEIITGEPVAEFWWAFSMGAPFTWGDNNRTMVCASDSLRHVAACEVEADVPKNWLEEVREVLQHLGDIYIDLEN